MEPSVESKIQRDDEEKRIQLLIQIGRESHENHYKKVSNAITTSGFIITVNGIIILAIINLIQFTIDKNNLFLHPKGLLLISIISLFLSMLSIFCSISFIHMINPVPHDLSSFSNLLKPIPYDDLLKLEYETLFKISQTNYEKFNEYRDKFYQWALIFLGGSIGSLGSLIIIINLFNII
ncbi:MAG: hypothetical protein OS112_05720 [Methanoregula sp.]|nr:MAG: hypothetical protein OS112_05720 [Methanoregula sp.]